MKSSEIHLDVLFLVSESKSVFKIGYIVYGLSFACPIDQSLGCLSYHMYCSYVYAV